MIIIVIIVDMVIVVAVILLIVILTRTQFEKLFKLVHLSLRSHPQIAFPFYLTEILVNDYLI